MKRVCKKQKINETMDKKAIFAWQSTMFLVDGRELL